MSLSLPGSRPSRFTVYLSSEPAPDSFNRSPERSLLPQASTYTCSLPTSHSTRSEASLVLPDTYLRPLLPSQYSIGACNCSICCHLSVPSSQIHRYISPTSYRPRTQSSPTRQTSPIAGGFQVSISERLMPSWTPKDRRPGPLNCFLALSTHPHRICCIPIKVFVSEQVES